jgi:hypothetical protein
MAKMSELDLILKEIYAAANSLIEATDSLRKFFSQPDEERRGHGETDATMNIYNPLDVSEAKHSQRYN